MATERVGIEIEIMGYNEARRQLEGLENSLKKLNGSRARVGMEKDLKRLEQQAIGLRAQLDKLRHAQMQVERGSAMWRVYAEAMAQTRAQMSATTAEAQRLKAALRNVNSVSQMFKNNTSRIAHIGQAMQSMGNAITRLTAPMRMLTTGALLGAGFGAMSKIEEGLSSGFSRYDTMKKYPKIMQSFGYSAEQANKSIDKLDQSVRGLPTGLDEMVDMAQRFTATTGDIEKGTDLAIAANNAFLASMSTDTQRYQGMMQLQDVLGGKKMNAREWNSLVSSMTPAIVKMGESMGYTNKNMDEWIQKVRDGKVSNEDFIDTLIKVGTAEGEVAKMANQSKDTWQAFSANVGNAFSRMTYGVLKSMDKIVATLDFTDQNGDKITSLNMLLTDKVIPGIDNMTKSAKKWIKAHPDEIKDFFSDLASIDWKGLGTGFLEFAGDMAEAIQTVAKMLQGKDLTKLGKFLAWLPLIGSGLTISGGLIKGGRHIFGGILTGIQWLVRGLGALGVGAALKKVGLVEKLMGKLSKVGKVFKGGKAASTAGKAAGVAGKAGAGEIFKGFLPAIEIIGGIGAIVTEITAIAALDTWFIKKAMDNIGAITGGIQTVFDNVNAIKSTDFDAGKLRDSVNSIFEIYGIIKGEQKQQRASFALTKGAGVSDKEDGLGNMSGLWKMLNNMKALKGIFKNIGSVFTSLQSMQGAGIGEIDFSFMENIKTMVEHVGEIATRIDSNANIKSPEALSEKMNSLVGTIAKLQTIASKLTALGSGDLASTDGGAFTAIDNIKALVQKLGTALNTEVVAGLQEQVDAFTTTVTGMFETLNADFESVEVTVNIKGDVTGDDQLISDIKAANSAIRNAVSSIQSVYTKHIYVHLQKHVNVTGDSVPTSLNPYTGGYISGNHTRPLYRSKGGDILGNIFKPRLTDTIPAMLTPGEYVQRKAAVDFFGVKFMQAINNLDVRGAMRELSARAGAMSASARRSVVYNITNNNQKFNQTVHTNNPNFAFKRSRAMAAL